VLEIRVHQDESGVAVIAVAGRVVLGAESQRIESQVHELLQTGQRKIVFDLAGVSHIDSTGIGRFIAALNATLRAGGKLAIAAPAGQVRESFRLTRLDTIFSVYDTVEAALDALSKSA